MNLNHLRPSSILAAAEDGVFGVFQLLGDVAKAGRDAAALKRRQLRNEYRARQLANANMLARKVNKARSAEEIADLNEVVRRTEELLAKRTPVKPGANRRRKVA